MSTIRMDILCVHEIVKKEKRNPCHFCFCTQITKVMATVCDKYIVKMEKELQLWLEDMNRKCVSADGSVLCQKALSLYEDFSRGAPKMSDTRPFTAGKGWLHRFRKGSG